MVVTVAAVVFAAVAPIVATPAGIASAAMVCTLALTLRATATVAVCPGTVCTVGKGRAREGAERQNGECRYKKLLHDWSPKLQVTQTDIRRLRRLAEQRELYRGHQAGLNPAPSNGWYPLAGVWPLTPSTPAHRCGYLCAVRPLQRTGWSQVEDASDTDHWGRKRMLDG